MYSLMIGSQALLPVMLRTCYAEDPAFREVGTVFTFTIWGYRVCSRPDILPLAQFPWDLFTMSRMEFLSGK